MGSSPLRAAGVEEALRSGSAAADAAARADEGTEPPGDLNASPEYRRHLAQVLVRRALEAGAGLSTSRAGVARRDGRVSDAEHCP